MAGFRRMGSFEIHLFYFIGLSFLGFWILKKFDPKVGDPYRTRDLDLFFTSVSAVTVSSMCTVDMEVFSEAQLVVLTILMLIGSEVFTSMVGIFLQASRLRKFWPLESAGRRESVDATPDQTGVPVIVAQILGSPQDSGKQNYYLVSRATKTLGFVVLSHLVVSHVVGIALLWLYVALEASAREVLTRKGLNLFLFSAFTIVSTFASCGFVPTSENIVVFRKNPGLLWILIPQALIGNVLYPPCLRVWIHVLSRFWRREELGYLLSKRSAVRYRHLLGRLHSWFLLWTVVVFVVIQVALFCAMEWKSDTLSGLSRYEKLVGALFQSVNSRHTGETIVDLSAIAPAMLVVFIVMMYLPPYTSFLPKKDEGIMQPRTGKAVETLVFSQLSYLSIFVVLVCIVERKRIRDDPLNFSVVNIVTEVISGYGNVGFTTGYSCKRQLIADPSCQDKATGFVGRWSDEGKLILIIAMFFGRLKKFNMNGGQAWKLF